MRQQFLEEVESVAPWRRLLGSIAPHYPKAGPKGGRPPIALDRMLQGYFLQSWYALSDLMLKEALCNCDLSAEGFA